MNKRVLFVDDEPNVLSAVQRTLRGHFEVETCDDPTRAASMLCSPTPFAVLVSDMRMPGMNGIELLAEAKKAAPDTVRVMLTGNADQQTAIDAVNKGEIFRFLSKPTDPAVLRSVLELGVRQHQLITAEKELLERTLNGSLKVLADILSIVKPEIFGRTDRLRAKAKEIAARLGGIPEWELDTAASLALLGCVGLSAEVLDKVLQGAALNATQKLEYVAHPLLAADLVKNIPRMENIADTLLYQHKHFDGTGFPGDQRRGDDLPIGARILHVVLAYDELKNQGWSDASIYENLRGQKSRFDPKVLVAFGACIGEAGASKVLRIPIKEIRDGMRIEEDVKTMTGILLVCHGQEVTPTVRQHLTKFHDAGLLGGQVLVMAARDKAASAA
ncbi:MAG: HD domain-containing phosphohydrolase [Gammaproteobacteria bacterium]